MKSMFHNYFSNLLRIRAEISRYRLNWIGIVVEIPGYQMEHFHVYRCIQQNNENIIKNLGTKAPRVMKWYKNVSRWKEQ